MSSLGWSVLVLVFLDEVLAAVAAGIWGAHAHGVASAVLAPTLVVVVWWAFASPKAPYGGRVVRPVVKVLVFGSASWGLWVADHHGWAVALLAFSVVINAVAQLSSIRTLAEDTVSRRD
ncbi:DUF2568 domain-containing protein [Nocardioides sp. LHG3406-4]|uniref:DUF2568 domain-containing protein n=1 Tax=Nocardioides sp. LHG3406-4 TaxID=2804575 RepID=UPI003CEBEE5F